MYNRSFLNKLGKTFILICSLSINTPIAGEIIEKPSSVPTFYSNVLNLPVVLYSSNFAAKVKLKLNFDTNTFEIVTFESFDCSQLKTQFSPYPTLLNYNPCDFK